MAAVPNTPSLARVDGPSGIGAGSATRPRARAVLGWAVVAVVIFAASMALRRYRADRAVSPLHYATATVDRGPVVARVTATGTLSALVTVLVGSQVSGRVDKLFVDYGSAVTAGQTIALLEPSLFRAAVGQARANRAAAKAAVERAQAQETRARRGHARASALLAEGLASRSEFEAAEAEAGAADAEVRSAEAVVAQTTAALEQAELNLRYTRIASPIDGVVVSRNVDVGQTVAATLQAPTLFTIAQDLTRMQVDTNVAESDVGKVRAGMPVTFTVDAHPGRVFGGTVRQVRDNAQTVQNVVTYDAVIDVDNGERLLKPGMTASVNFAHATRESALRVPNGALRFRPDAAALAAMSGGAPAHAASAAPAGPDGRVVWVLRGGRPVAVPARVGISDGRLTEVISGELREGDAAVLEATPAEGRGGEARRP